MMPAQQASSNDVRLALARKIRPANPSLAIVIPVFNESETVSLFMDRMQAVETSLQAVGCQLRYIFINDGSRDDTLEKLINIQCEKSNVFVMDLSRNFGKEAALTAGIAEAVNQQVDLVVPIDVDLQDPPELIVDMLAKWRQGYQLVLARRIDRSTDGLLKAWSALVFYRFFNTMSRQKLPENVGDFRLMDRQVAEAIGHLNERSRMMKALMNWVGFSRTFVDFHRASRSAGASTFNARSLFSLGISGFLAFSTAPLRAILIIGILIAVIAFFYGAYIALKTLVQGVDVAGYASTLVIILVSLALQLITLGIVGEYVARLIEEVKARPNYLIAQKINASTAHDLQMRQPEGNKKTKNKGKS